MNFVRMVLPALVALTCCSAVADAQSLIRTVAGKSFDLVTPDGFCVPDPKESGDAGFVNAVSRFMEGAGNTVVQVVADCGELNLRHADPSSKIFNYMVYYYPAAIESLVLSGSPQPHRKTLCDEMRKQGDASLSDVPQLVAKTARELQQTVSVNSTKVLGVLAEDTHGCYVGVLVGIDDGKGLSLLMNATIIATVIHGKGLFVSLYSQYVSPEASDKSLQLAKATAAALDLKNSD
jgi:hypothetical protein